MEKKYARLVYDEAGNFNLGTHTKFMDGHADHMALLGMDVSRIRNGATLAREVKRTADAATALEKSLRVKFGGRLIGAETTDPLNIAKEINDNLSFRQGREVMAALPADLADEVREHSLQQMRREMASNGDTQISYTKLNRYVEERGQALAAIHGTQYVTDLRKLRDVQELVSRGRQARAGAADVQSQWLDLTRSLFGPLSKKQRFITAVQRNGKRQQANVAREIMSNPEDLRKYVKLGSFTPLQMAFWLTISDLGIEAFVPDSVKEAGFQAAEKLSGLPSSERQRFRDRIEKARGG